MLSDIAGTVLHRFRSLLFRDTGKPASLLPARIIPLDIPLPPDEKTGFRSYPVFSGLTTSGGLLAAHVSVLNPGKIPHPLHAHEEEEILILLQGELDLISSPEQETTGTGRRHVEPGHLLLYPAGFPHTIQSVGTVPANYLMVKWSAGRKNPAPALAFGQYILADYRPDSADLRDFHPTVLFEGSTHALQKIQCHLSLLAPGAGYGLHADPYDVVMVVLEGRVKTCGERVQPDGVIFFASGEPHGMENPGNLPAMYIVIEFHW
jgi:mannose-6-phosphate isomerase-like protein (cupin superfamily)